MIGKNFKENPKGRELYYPLITIFANELSWFDFRRDSIAFVIQAINLGDVFQRQHCEHLST